MVFKSHYAFVWRSLRRLGVQPDGVDDAVQDVFIVVHRRLPEFEGRASVRTWLFRIALRVASNHRRRQRAQPVSVDTQRLTGELGTVDLSQTEARAVLDALLAQLPERQRAVFVAVELEGLRGPEVAQALGIRVNTVYSRLRLARARMLELAKPQ